MDARGSTDAELASLLLRTTAWDGDQTVVAAQIRAAGLMEFLIETVFHPLNVDYFVFFDWLFSELDLSYHVSTINGDDKSQWRTFRTLL